MPLPSKDDLARLAATAEPKWIPPTIRLWYTDNTIAIFDKSPKATYHFLLLPRPRLPEWTLWRLNSLRGLFRGDKEAGRNLLLMLKKESEQIVWMIRDEMTKTYGTTWPIWLGFHCVPSMEHIHLHIISSDLVSDNMKTKKHYNSFHPTLGFFLHLDDILGWYDLPAADFKKNTLLPLTTCQDLLSEDLQSFRTGHYHDTMPALKKELEHEWRKELARLMSTKRKRELAQREPNDEGQETEDESDESDESEEEARPAKKTK